MRLLEAWMRRLKLLEREIYALSLASKDPRVPWYAKLFAAGVVAYALSPIDLIPDFIPLLGYLDDLLLVPLGLALAIKMIPKAVLTECREKALVSMAEGRPRNWVAGGVIIGIWTLTGAMAVVLLLRALT